MREHAGQGTAHREVPAGVPGLGPAPDQGDAAHHGPLQRPAESPPGERAQVLPGAGPGGHEGSRGQPGQGDFPVSDIKTLSGGRY